MSFQYGQLSDDGRWWWDGYQWQPAQPQWPQQPPAGQIPGPGPAWGQQPQVVPGSLSADGQWRWDGQQWIAATRPQVKGKSHTGVIVGVAVLGGVLLLGLVAVAFGSNQPQPGSAASSASPRTSSAPIAPGATPTRSVEKGIGSQDASGDVTLGPIKKSEFGGVTVVVMAKNSSPKRSNYAVDLAAESPDGKTQYATTLAYIENVEPGQTAKDEAAFIEDIPANAKVVVQTVERTSAVG